MSMLKEAALAELLDDGEESGADAFFRFFERDPETLELALGGVRLLRCLVLEGSGETSEHGVGVGAFLDQTGERRIEALECLEVSVVRLREGVRDGREILSGSR